MLGAVLADHQAVVNYEVEQVFPAIGHRSMLLNAVRVRKPGNHSDLILLAIEDVTERKRSEATTRRSEVRYRRLFESAKDGILILDTLTGVIRDANPFMSELLDYPRADLIGKELWEIGLFSDRSQSEAAVRELQATGYIRYEDLPLESRLGRRVEVEIVANAYREGDDSVIQCNIRDITERTRMERKVKEQAEALADLHRRKDEFLAMLSHELRNPLAPISNALQLLRLQEREDPLQRQARAIIERQVGQLKRLIDDLMEVSRITTGRVQLRLERITVGGLVERAVETARPLIGQRRHELVVAVPPEPIWLYADASRLEQVVVNLLTNAAKYTPDGGRIGLTVSREGDEAVLRVRDTGIGIDPELLPRIFDLFTQAERSLARSEGGLGIGLALVQQLVELHRGHVEAHSSLGRGSEFVVRLPVTLDPAPPAAVAPAGAKSAGSLRILVVDDNVDAALSLADVLRACRHHARTAHDGLTAVQTAIDYRPDVVLLDIGLPELDGLEVARRIRQQPALAGVVLVAVTGYGLASDRELSRVAGFDHHLIKPTEFEAVQAILATVTPR
ncbi:MAG: hybrid sensor histidine kinase/response regulator, partial [Gemmataceae bacterium]